MKESLMNIFSLPLSLPLFLEIWERGRGGEGITVKR
jgi:hypothetical protein